MMLSRSKKTQEKETSVSQKNRSGAGRRAAAAFLRVVGATPIAPSALDHDAELIRRFRQTDDYMALVVTRNDGTITRDQFRTRQEELFVEFCRHASQPK